MTDLAPRPWLAPAARDRIDALPLPADPTAAVERLAAETRAIHDDRAFNLNPATNVMNPRAEALMAAGLGSRPSLGQPGDKYETGLEAIEQIEVIAARLAARVFGAGFVECRVPSGAIANLMAFMALAKPGDAIIAPPPAIGGHVTHHAAGCAGLYGLVTHPAPVDAAGYSVDVDALRDLARAVRPKIITIGASLNLFPHPVAALRELADEVGAHLMFDAAHLCGMIAGGAWPNPLAEGAHVMTMSTYKSLGGPPGGLIVTNEARIAQRLDAIAFPGLTANFDAGKTAALAVTLQNWTAHGPAYARHMGELARALAQAAEAEGLPVFSAPRLTESHQFALDARPFGGGQAMAKRLAQAGFLACGIGLPLPEIPGDMNGLRIGTPELARRGVALADAPQLMALFGRALREDPATVAAETAALRARFTDLRYAD
ncbi:serine hydroxymethyltransferase [Jannaschia ovalis]|uniref:Aminotransferase class I/II-fold pyridoxal phosphate-dependent enzyme n=1 Tax=Jannaschia ovalis TaxID=3038773 RepID=A0ABY8LED6_9RHOB|nr:aminotransferase class I/II-fold pyridoxal phosphate-dependent enzyme [Jannaschia sp. GRR-S6-38]WGH79669.1 aminotransferase class I/II-fold pyridoxal phosphate-dependent enzyme [Jannaschia sp. GRR-S6-38]